MIDQEFERFMTSQFAKMEGKGYLEIQEQKELKNIFTDPYIQAEKKFIFDLFEGVNPNSVSPKEELFSTKNYILKIEENLHTLITHTEKKAKNRLLKSSLPENQKEIFEKVLTKEINQAEVRFFGALNSHITVGQIFYSYDFNNVLKTDRSFSRPKSSCFKGREKITNFSNEIKISKDEFESFGLKVPETLEEFTKANQGPKFLTRKMASEEPSLKRSICYLDFDQLSKILIDVKNCNCVKIFLNDLRKCLTHEYIYEKPDLKDINLSISGVDPIKGSKVDYNSTYDNLKNTSNLRSKKHVNIKYKKEEPSNTFFYNNRSNSNKNILFVNRKNLIAKYHQQKAEREIQKNKIKISPYVSEKLVSQKAIIYQNLKTVTGPFPVFTFGELGLIAFINVIYYINKFLKKLGLKGLFIN